MRLGPYELVRLVGAGGMGEVWSAHPAGHPAAGSETERLAVKRLPAHLANDPGYRQSLLDEARLASLLDHPNIVKTLDAGEADGEAYIAMEFVDGIDLSRLRKLLDHTGEPLSPAVCAYVIGEVLCGLAYAHSLVHEGELISLVHRDVSPHNVILSVDGEVKLTDFGVARLSSEDTSGTHVKGKARYMPPEQLRGESRSPKVDLFAAGAVLHEMLDNRLFRGEAVDDARLLGMAIDGLVPEPHLDLSGYGELETVRRGLLEPDPEQRIASANEALDLIHAWPGYRDAAVAELGALVRRYLELAASLVYHPGLDDLERQATFLQTQAAVRVESSADLFGDAVMASPGQLLDEPPPADPPNDTKRAQHPRRPLETGPQPTVRQHAGRPSGSRAKPKPKPKPEPGPKPKPKPEDDFPAPPPVSAAEAEAEPEPVQALARQAVPQPVHQAVPETAHQAPRIPAPSRTPSTDSHPRLEVDDQPTFARHVATSPNPIVPPRRPGRTLALVLALTGLGVGGWFGGRHLLDQAGPAPSVDPTPEQVGLRKVRVAGEAFAGYTGFRLLRLDQRLVVDNINYSFVDVDAKAGAGPEPRSPLATLRAGEAEFALTTLDQLLLDYAADGELPGKIVAVVDLSAGGDALVLDTAEFPQLRDLGDLEALARKSKFRPQLGYARGTPSEYLAARLDALLPALDAGGLEHDPNYGDVGAVFDALTLRASGPDAVVAALLWEPWISKAQAAGMSVAVSTRDLPDAVIDVLVASDAVLAADPEAVKALVAAYYGVIASQQRDDADLVAAAVASLGLTQDEARQALAGTCLLDAARASPWLHASPGRPARLGPAVAATWATLGASGRLDAAASPALPTLDALVDPGPLTAALSALESAPSEEAPELDQPRLCPTTAAGVEARQDLGELALPGSDGPWFGPGDGTLAAEQAPALAELGARLRAFNPNTVSAEVTGFGDSRGGDRSLGKLRAEAVSAGLRQAGVVLPISVKGASGRDAPPALIRIELRRVR